LGDGEEVLGPLGIALGAVAREPADPALGVPPPEAHVLLVPRAVRAAIGTSHTRDDGRPFRQGADASRDAPEGFVAEHEHLRAGRRLAVFAALDLGIGPAQPDPHHVDERFAVARAAASQLGARAVYAERRGGGAGREFRRGFGLARGERVLAVDDIMTSGGSLHETIAAVRAARGEVVAAAVLVDRSGGDAHLDVPLLALWSLAIPTYAAGECPLCGYVPMTHPGTSAPGGAAPREPPVEAV